jgi:hypothetical protein
VHSRGIEQAAVPLAIAKHTKVDMIWVAGRSPTLVSYSLRGVAMNLKATTLTYLAIYAYEKVASPRVLNYRPGQLSDTLG